MLGRNPGRVSSNGYLTDFYMKEKLPKGGNKKLTWKCNFTLHLNWIIMSLTYMSTWSLSTCILMFNDIIDNLYWYTWAFLSQRYLNTRIGESFFLVLCPCLALSMLFEFSLWLCLVGFVSFVVTMVLVVRYDSLIIYVSKRSLIIPLSYHSMFLCFVTAHLVQLLLACSFFLIKHVNGYKQILHSL